MKTDNRELCYTAGYWLYRIAISTKWLQKHLVNSQAEVISARVTLMRFQISLPLWPWRAPASCKASLHGLLGLVLLGDSEKVRSTRLNLTKWLPGWL